MSVKSSYEKNTTEKRFSYTANHFTARLEDTIQETSVISLFSPCWNLLLSIVKSQQFLKLLEASFKLRYKRRARFKEKESTQGPVYYEFGSYKHPATTNKIFSLRWGFVIDIHVQQVWILRVPIITSTFLWIKLLVVRGTQCTFQLFASVTFWISWTNSCIKEISQWAAFQVHWHGVMTTMT